VADNGRVVDAVIFDLGGVLMSNGRPSDAARRYPDADPAQVTAALMGPYGEDTDHPWHRLERGEITMAHYQADTRAHLAALGILRARTGTPAERPARPSAGPTSPRQPPDFEFLANDAMIALARSLRAAGVLTGMLTNNVREIRPHWWSVADWPTVVDDIVDSHEVGMRKPNPAIYHLALERLGAVASRTAFLDDILSNVQGATQVGMIGIHVEGLGAAAISRVSELVAR